MTSIIYLSKEQIARRRDELLSNARLDVDELRERGATFQLSPEQAVILKELEDLEFLAGA